MIRSASSTVPEASVGDYVIVHVGFALSRVDHARNGFAISMRCTKRADVAHDGVYRWRM